MWDLEAIWRDLDLICMGLEMIRRDLQPICVGSGGRRDLERSGGNLEAIWGDLEGSGPNPKQRLNYKHLHD